VAEVDITSGPASAIAETFDAKGIPELAHYSLRRYCFQYDEHEQKRQI